MQQENRSFDPMPYARLRTYNDGTGKEMRAQPVPTGEDGALVCAPMGKNRWQIGWEWDQPRDILGLSVDFAPESPLPTDWHVEYWHYSWPNEQKDRRTGAHKGWLLTDDTFHGQWLAAYGEQSLHRQGCGVVFDHIDVNELLCLGGDAPQRLFLSDDYNAMFRRALKFRLVFEGATAPRIAAIRLKGEAQVAQDACLLHANATGKAPGRAVCVEGIHNGALHSGSGLAQGCVALTYTRTVGARSDADQTLLELRVDGVGFAVRAEDVLAGVYMEDFDLLLAPESMGRDAAAIVQGLLAGKQSIFDRVADHPEQTVRQAMADVPEMRKPLQPKYGRYLPMGLEGVRQKFALRYNGDIFANKIDQKVSARDTAKTRWAANELHFRIASGDPPRRMEEHDDATQSMPDARVPLYVTHWLDREIEYHETCFVTRMAQQDTPVRGDDDVMVMCRIKLRNASSDARTAHLFVELYPGEQLALDGTALMAQGRVRPGDTSIYGWAVQPYDRPCLRACINPNGRGTLRCVPYTAGETTSQSMQPQFGFEAYDRNPTRMPPSSCADTALLYEVVLDAYETHTLELVLPYPSLMEHDAIRQVGERSFDTELVRVRSFWHRLSEEGASLHLPGETHLNAFAQAVPWHVALSTMRDPRTGLTMVPAGTFGYGACGNEAAMQIRMMDCLGYHDRAETYLDTFLATQGQGSMDGNFQTDDGALLANNYGGYSDNPTSLFAYNLDHGYILACMVDHYRLTGDREWLFKAAPVLVKACDYIATERRATMVMDDQGLPVSYYGLMPHGHLEDNPEWRCWFAVNAHACGGMLGVGEVLHEVAHPDAIRIQQEAQAFRSDIRTCVARAVSHSQAVPTGNGGYMPHVPTQAELRGRDWGWFREVAYGALHLASCNVLAPDEALTTWILHDQEDNLFLSRDWGRPVDREKHWFSRGGMTIQSNLLFNDQLYLQRDEPARAIRGLFNNFAQNLYRDVFCFTEHPITDFGKGFGPFYKTSDEAQFITNLRNHLIQEEGRRLYLLRGASREWFAAGKEIRFAGMATWFGKVGLTLTVADDGQTIHAVIEAKWRETPEMLVLCLRTPAGAAPRRVLLGGLALGADACEGEKLRLKNPAEHLELTLQY